MTSSRQYKMSGHASSWFVYPHPVVVEQKFLLLTSSAFQAALLLHCLRPGYLADPLARPELYESWGIHQDGKTPCCNILLSELHLEFLPERNRDLARAKAIEGIISRKVAKLYSLERDSQEAQVLMQEIQHRFATQQACSECQSLGILEPGLKQWFEDLKLLLLLPF